MRALVLSFSFLNKFPALFAIEFSKQVSTLTLFGADRPVDNHCNDSCLSQEAIFFVSVPVIVGNHRLVDSQQWQFPAIWGTLLMDLSYTSPFSLC